MMNLYFIYNGHRKMLIGHFTHIHSAINELKKHQASYSAISHPRFRKSMSGENIRGQVKKNNYITLHKSMLEKIIKTMGSFKETEETEEK